MPTVAGRCSIVIPAYDVEPYVGAAVESALAQDYADVEVIVVDDGSSDGTVAEVRRFGADVRLLRHSVNRGTATALNTGISAATGEFIAILGADDAYARDRVRRCVQAIRGERVPSFATTDALLVKEGSLTTDRYYANVRWEPGNALVGLANTNYIFAAIVLPRLAWEDLGGFDPLAGRAEDYDFNLRLLLCGWRPVLVDAPLSVYRQRPDSSSADGLRQLAAHYDVLGRHIPAIAAQGASGLFGPAYRTATHLWRKGECRSALRIMRIALKDEQAPARLRARVALRCAVWSAACLRPSLPGATR